MYWFAARLLAQAAVAAKFSERGMFGLSFKSRANLYGIPFRVLNTCASQYRTSDSAAVWPEIALLQLAANRSSTVPRRTCVTTSMVTTIMTTSTIGRTTPFWRKD